MSMFFVLKLCIVKNYITILHPVCYLKSIQDWIGIEMAFSVQLLIIIMNDKQPWLSEIE